VPPGLPRRCVRGPVVRAKIRATLDIIMNTSCPTPTLPERGFFASLQRLINTSGMVSVDLTDTIFAHAGNRDSLAAKPDAGPLPERPDQARMMSIRLP